MRQETVRSPSAPSPVRLSLEQTAGGLPPPRACSLRRVLYTGPRGSKVLQRLPLPRPAALRSSFRGDRLVRSDTPTGTRTAANYCERRSTDDKY